MNKTDSLSSNTSRTSSETSETQSVEENTLVGGIESRLNIPQPGNFLIDRSTRKSKRMKDATSDKEAEKRPPWRAVSLSTLPKPDKNALLKAKLLDASRRLRSGKVSLSTQTDIVPTKLMKEVSLGVQADLVLLREVGIMTDGSYMKKKQGTDEFVLTYCVSTITDAVQHAEVATQTLLPKLPENENNNINSICDTSTMGLHDFDEIQKKLLGQITNLRQALILNDHSDGVSPEVKEIEVQKNSNNFPKPSLLNSGTIKSWHFELDEIGNESSTFRPYTITPNRPWKSFTPLVYNGYFTDYVGSQRLDWNILFMAIDELIQESNHLVDLIEDLSRPRIEVVEIPCFEKCSKKLPSDYWLPIVEQQEKKIEAMKKNMRKSSPK